MAELKTKPGDESVSAFLAKLDERRRTDCETVLALMKKTTRQEPRMWGGTIVGFGSYHYKYASGREGDWFLTGFSPRKQNLTIYLMSGFEPFPDLMAKLGKYKTGKSCLYVNRLEEIDLKVLGQLIAKSVAEMKKISR